MDRQKKTPEQRATETLGVARRAVARWADKVSAAEDDRRAAKAELDKAVARLEYVAANPDLKDADAYAARTYAARFAKADEREPEPVPED